MSWLPSSGLPFDLLNHALTREYVQALAHANWLAGYVDGIRLHPYSQRRLQQQTKLRRIFRMVKRSRLQLQVTPDQLRQVLLGERLPPDYERHQERIMCCAVLCDAAERRGDRVSTPADAQAYLEYSAGDAPPRLVRFVGKDWSGLLDQYVSKWRVPDAVERLYAWLAADPALAEAGIPRAATIYWGLSATEGTTSTRAGLDALLDHELRAAGFDGRGLLLLDDQQTGPDELDGRSDRPGAFDFSGDLTPLFTDFARAISDGLEEVRKQVAQARDRHDRLPWMETRMPDDLDRQIFAIIEQAGTVTSQAVLTGLPDPPPLRTLQRRLQALVSDGLVVRVGGRKNATYRVVEDW
jgi:hypothetical protein